MSCNPNVYDDTTPLMGVILSGGNSKRMGSDKGLLLKDGIEWSRLNYEKLESLGIPVCVSVNSSQLNLYKSIFDESVLVPDNIEIKGPLGGLLSVHEKYPEYDLLILACDLPDLSVSLIKDLINEFDERSGEHDFFVYANDNELEPLVGVYTTEGLNKIYSLYLSGQLEKHSMKYILDEGNTYVLQLNDYLVKQFKNYNQKEDLE